MTYICSTGISIPNHSLQQEEVKELVKSVFSSSNRQVERLLPVFDHAEISSRQFVVEKSWFEADHSFQERNHLYQIFATRYALKAMDDCLRNRDFLKTDIPYDAIDLIIFVSSTGISTPSIDCFLLNERAFRQDIARMPLWGLGCAGGAMGLARAHDWLTANQDKTALLVCCELCSLTFQKGDMKKSNIVGTALFGDGISASLLIGDLSPWLSNLKDNAYPKIKKTSSHTKRDSTTVMGWDVTNEGLEVVFSKSIPALVSTFWKDHISIFLQQTGLRAEELYSFIAHPGGKKVLEAMEEVLQCSKGKLKHSYQVLKHHGNMSSSTVLYVLREWMKENIAANEKSVLTALGPGFSSEILLLEWVA